MVEAALVRPLEAADLPAYKALRDAVLAAHPEAFTSDADAERRKEPADHLQRLGIGQPSRGHFLLGAFDRRQPPRGLGDQTLIGALNCERDMRIKARHIGHLAGMMVATGLQGRGLGRLLLDAAIAEARRADGIELMTLSVTEGNDAAVGLYESRGFVVYGRLEDAMRLGTRRLTKLLMVLRL